MSIEPFEVYALRYASAARRPADVFIGADPHEGTPAGTVQMDYYIWLVRNTRHTFVIDTGFDQAASIRRKRDFLRAPGDALRLLGVDAGAVEQVVITHLHYDHAGNLGLFPRARFHLQDSEMAYATGRHMAVPFFGHAYEPDDVCSMVRLSFAGRIQFHDGDEEIVPGLSVHHIGGHTQGLQAVRVHTCVGALVLASDALHYLANMESLRPFPIVADVTRMVAGWQRLRQLADSPQHIVPGHDPRVLARYPAPAAALQGAVARLDEEPRDIPSS